MENNPNKFLQYRKSRFSNLDLLPLYAAVDEVGKHSWVSYISYRNHQGVYSLDQHPNNSKITLEFPIEF